MIHSLFETVSLGQICEVGTFRNTSPFLFCLFMETPLSMSSNQHSYIFSILNSIEKQKQKTTHELVGPNV